MIAIQSRSREIINKFNTQKGKLQLIKEFTELLETHDFDDLEIEGVPDIVESHLRCNLKKTKHKPSYMIATFATIVRRRDIGKRKLNLSEGI